MEGRGLVAQRGDEGHVLDEMSASVRVYSFAVFPSDPFADERGTWLVMPWVGQGV